MALFPLALSVGLLAGIWAFVSPSLGVLTWPAFIGWAFFFVAGGEIKTIPKAALPLASGVLLAWVAVLAGSQMGSAGIPVAVAIVAAVMVLMGNYALFAVIPAQFVGAAVFFGAGADLLATLISLAAGILIGIVSVTLPALVPGRAKAPAAAG
jgi:hypothetical protein